MYNLYYTRIYKFNETPNDNDQVGVYVCEKREWKKETNKERR